MFICKWEPMDEWGNAEGPDIDWLSFSLGVLGGIFLGMIIMAFIL